jgi:hypothetical protein
MPRRSSRSATCHAVQERVVLLVALLGSTGSMGCSSKDVALPYDGGPPPEAAASGDSSLGGGTTTADGGFDAGSRQLITLANVGRASVLRIDAHNAYALGGNFSTIVQIPLAGGSPTNLVSLGSVGFFQDFAVSATTVYAVEPEDPYADASYLASGTILGVPIGGGAVANVATGQTLPIAIAVDSTTVYWANSGCTLAGCEPAVMAVPFGGGTPVAVASGLAKASSLTTLAVDGANVYWGTSDGRVMKAPNGGGAATTLAFYETNVLQMVIDATSVYWATGTGDVIRTPIAGGASSNVVVGVDSIEGIAVDSTALYWTTPSSGGFASNLPAALHKVSLAGGAPETLCTSFNDVPLAVQVDATSVYFTTNLGAVNRLTPK